MKIRSRYQALMTISLVMAVAFGGAWLAMIYKSYAMRYEIAAVSANSAQTASRAAYLLSLKDALSQSKDDLATIDSRFITKDQIPTVIDSIESRATNLGVTADTGSVSLDDAPDQSVPHALRLHLSGTGSWKAVVSLISSLESVPYVSNLDNLTLTAQGNGWGFDSDVVILVAN